MKYTGYNDDDDNDDNLTIQKHGVLIYPIFWQVKPIRKTPKRGRPKFNNLIKDGIIIIICMDYGKTNYQSNFLCENCPKSLKQPTSV